MEVYRFMFYLLTSPHRGFKAKLGDSFCHDFGLHNVSSWWVSVIFSGFLLKKYCKGSLCYLNHLELYLSMGKNCGKKRPCSETPTFLFWNSTLVGPCLSSRKPTALFVFGEFCLAIYPTSLVLAPCWDLPKKCQPRLNRRKSPHKFT